MNYISDTDVQPVAGVASLAGREDPTLQRTSTPIMVQYWNAVRRHKLVISAVIGAALILGVVATALMEPKYTASTIIEISREQENVVNVRALQPENAGENAEFFQTQYGLLRSRTLAERVANRLGLPTSDEFFFTFDAAPDEAALEAMSLQAKQRRAMSILLDNITIAPLRGSGLVTIEFRSPSPELSASVANAWAEEFIRSNQDRRFASTAGARSFLEERLAELGKRLVDSERQLVTYARQREIINVSSNTDEAGSATSERSLVASELQSLSNALTAATAARIAAASEIGGSAGRDLISNPALNSLRQRRAELAAEYARVLEQFEPEYPAARALSSQLDDLDASIGRQESRVRLAAQGEYQRAQAREAGLRAQVDNVTSDLMQQQSDRIQYNIYKRDADTNRQLYDALLQRYKEIGVAGIGASTISIIDPAQVPNSPSSPSLLINILLSFLLGTVLAGLAVVTIEQIDQTIKNPAHAAEVLELPVLGGIPIVKDQEPLEALQDPKGPIAEAYVSVRTNLSLATDHGLPHSFVLTSTRQGEAKSTSSVALALAVARLGKRVVVIDADMRNPTMHKLIELPNEAGLSNFLAGEDELGRILHEEVAFGLSIISGGPSPPNPSELLSGERLGVLIQRLRQRFDHVIIDAPPVLGLADVPLIIQAVEGAVYVVEVGGPKVGDVRSSLDRLRQVNGTIFGVIVSRLDTRETDYAYQYAYGVSGGKT